MRAMAQRSCEECGSLFETTAYKVAIGEGRLCSLRCAGAVGGRRSGPGTSRATLHSRAREIWIERHGRKPICWCGKPADIHHDDGDPTNNDERNHVPLCRGHHIALENARCPKRRKAA